MFHHRIQLPNLATLTLLLPKDFTRIQISCSKLRHCSYSTLLLVVPVILAYDYLSLRRLKLCLVRIFVCGGGSKLPPIGEENTHFAIVESHHANCGALNHPAPGP